MTACCSQDLDIIEGESSDADSTSAVESAASEGHCYGERKQSDLITSHTSAVNHLPPR